MRKPFLKLQPKAWQLIVISGIFSLSVALSNTFVNVYLWKVDKTYGALGFYNLFLYVTVPLTFVLAGIVASRKTSVWPLRIGIFSHVVFYIVTLVGGTAIANLPVILGVVMGFAEGMYWFAFNTLSMEFTHDGERDRFFGFNGVMGALAGMIAPPVAGFLIAREDKFGPVTGYHVIFVLSLALFVVATFITFRVKSQAAQKPLQWAVATSALKKQWWRLLLVGCGVYGLREGVFLFLIGLLIYVATGSEMKLGEFVLLQSAISFASFYVVGRFVRPANRLKVMGIGAMAMAGAAAFFLMPIRPFIIVLYGSVIALVIPLFIIPLQGYVFDGIGALDEGDVSNEHIIAREVFQNAGRVLGIGGFLLLSRMFPKATFVPTLAIGLGVVQIFTWGLVRAGGIDKLLNRSRQETDDQSHREHRKRVLHLHARRVWTLQNGESKRSPRESKPVLFRRSPF